MLSIYKIGDKKFYNKNVNSTDIAAFESGIVHDVYATFAIARDAEWCCRLFVLDMKETDEEGIGTYVTVNHHAPAMVGANIIFTAEISDLHGNNVHCKWEAKDQERLIASGTTGQKILKKTKLESLFNSLK